jgi:putative membrane protein insertion efficiency factor
MEKSGKQIATTVLSFFVGAIKTTLVVPRGTCRFYPSCSEYAREALATLPLQRACFCIVKRLLKCNPFVTAGYDPVPHPTERRHCCE